MTTTVLSTTTIGAGPHFTFAAAGDQLIILPGVTIGATTGDAIADTSFDNVTLTLMGTIAGTNEQRFGGLGSEFHIVAGGTFVSTEGAGGNAGVFLTGTEETFINDGSFSANNSLGILSGGSNSIINAGSMQAASTIFLGLFSGLGDRFINSGTVTSNHSEDATRNIRYNNAVFTEGGNTQITNLASGTITALASEGAGVRFNSAAGGGSLSNSGEIISAQDFGVNLGTVSVGQAQIKVSNWGVISGADGAYNGSANDDLLVNRGQLVGDVAMGLGLDTMDNRRGTIEGNVYLGDGNDKYVGDGGRIFGAVDGGAGADFFFGNDAAADIFIGGDGIDTLDFRLGKAAILALDGSFAQDGAALGDSYSQIENVFGSQVGDDVIRGNSAANALFGWGGDDSLDGGHGVDVLRGGTGTDTLTGGAGNDVFRYQAVNELGDVITDFGNNVSSNDSFQFILSGFAAAGLSAGALAASQFQTRADNIAQDADDRFIFNTTDDTLWYDVDGTGSAAAVMVADLQAGAVVTASDMILI